MSRKLIVIDTNIFISAALSPQGKAYQAIVKAINQFVIVQSQATYEELTERIYKSKFDKYINDDDRQKFIRIIKNNSQFIKVKSQINICRDFDDNKFLELVIDANAEYLLTGDQDLLTLKSLTKYQNLIVDLKEFLELN
ncbi:MAG: putative toxin-antitoxin system toxin component, PIN family [Waterburya sp.]